MKKIECLYSFARDGSNTKWIQASHFSPFNPVLHFYNPWKRQKSSSFLTFKGGIEIERFLKMG